MNFPTPILIDFRRFVFTGAIKIDYSILNFRRFKKKLIKIDNTSKNLICISYKICTIFFYSFDYF